jgi:hypothetical protein
MRSTYLCRRKKSASRAGKASICPQRLRCRPHRISRAHSRSRAETNAFQRRRIEPTTVGDRQTEQGRRDYQGLRTLSGAAPVTKRSGKSLIVVRRYAAHVRLRDTVYTGHVSPPSAIPSVALDILRCVNVATRTVALSVVSRIDCLLWHVSFCSDRRCLIRTLADLPHNGAIIESAPKPRLATVRFLCSA